MTSGLSHHTVSHGTWSMSSPPERCKFFRLQNFTVSTPVSKDGDLTDTRVDKILNQNSSQPLLKFSHLHHTSSSEITSIVPVTIKIFGQTRFVRSPSFGQKQTGNPSRKGIVLLRWMPSTTHSDVINGVLEGWCKIWKPQGPLPQRGPLVPHPKRLRTLAPH